MSLFLRTISVVGVILLLIGTVAYALQFGQKMGYAHGHAAGVESVPEVDIQSIIMTMDGCLVVELTNESARMWCPDDLGQMRRAICGEVEA